MRKSMLRVSTILLSAAMIAGQISFLPSAAQAASISQLAGQWSMVLQGNTGCGSHSMFVTFKLNSSGNGTATIDNHSTGCATTTTTGNAISITALGNNGQGTAGLSCGVGCGWVFKIQVSADYDQIILADVSDDNPNNTPAGVAIRQFP